MLGAVSSHASLGVKESAMLTVFPHMCFDQIIGCSADQKADTRVSDVATSTLS